MTARRPPLEESSESRSILQSSCCRVSALWPSPVTVAGRWPSADHGPVVGLPPPAPGRTAVVTGASSGIGEAIARELAHRGYGVVLVARSVEKLEILAAELTAGGVRAEVLPTDLSNRSARAELLGHVERLGLIPDILVNNAGLSTLGPVAGSDPEAEMLMIEVDVVAVADLCSRFLPGMVERKRARCSTSRPPVRSSRCPVRPGTAPERPSCCPTPRA